MYLRSKSHGISTVYLLSKNVHLRIRAKIPYFGNRCEEVAVTLEYLARAEVRAGKGRGLGGIHMAVDAATCRAMRASRRLWPQPARLNRCGLQVAMPSAHRKRAQPTEGPCPAHPERLLNRKPMRQRLTSYDTIYI